MIKIQKPQFFEIEAFFFELKVILETKNPYFHFLKTPSKMKLGAFSISLSVKNLQISKEFYEKLGFSVFAGSDEMNYLIMKNEATLIGLFHEMFEKNILTFNPGWDQNANNLEAFDDVRSIQKHLKEHGILLAQEADPASSGPASILFFDPDGNTILIDQHV